MNLFQEYALIIGYLSFLLWGVGVFFYLRDMLLGTTRPNLVTWSLWAFAPLVGTGAALSAGAEWSTTLRIFGAGFFPLVVLLVALYFRKWYYKITILDKVCFICSLGALCIWLGTSLPVLAVILAATADFIAAIPTLIKAWKDPHSETFFNFAIGVPSSALAIMIAPSLAPEYALFPLYFITFNASITTIIYFRRKWIKL
jgi:hypothetical protein